MSQTDCSHITRYPSDHGRRKDFFQGGALGRGATSSSFCGGGNFHEISFNDVIVLNRGTTFSPWYNFFANGHNVQYFARRHEVHSIQTNAFCKTLVNKNKTERFTTALEAESLVSSEISDLRNF